MVFPAGSHTEAFGPGAIVGAHIRFATRARPRKRRDVDPAATLTLAAWIIAISFACPHGVLSHLFGHDFF